MGYPILEIVILEENPAMRERFSKLTASIQGWGIECLRFTSTDALALEWTRNFGHEHVLVIIGSSFVSTGGDRGHEFAMRIAELKSTLIGAWKMSEDQVLVLDGSESPREIDHLVREKIHAYMTGVDILLPL